MDILVRREYLYRDGQECPSYTQKRKNLVKAGPLLELAPDWRSLLTSAVDEEMLRDLRRHEKTGRSLGDDDFLNRLEKNLGRVLRRQKPGPKGLN